MDRLDMSLDDIIMHDRNRREKKNRTFRNQPQKTAAANRAQQQTQNNHAPRGGRGAGGGGGGGGAAGATGGQRKGGQVGQVVVLGNSGAGKTRVVTAAQRSRALPYARPNTANGTGRPAEIWTRKAVDAGSVRVLGVPQTGLVTTHSLQRSTRSAVSTGNRNRQVVVEPLVRQQRVVSAPPVAPSPQPISIRGVAGPVTVVLSHLDANTTADDIRLVSKQVGAVHKVTLLYDSSGKSTGTAEIVYANREAALAAVKRFDNVVADGQLVRCYVKPGPGDPIPPPAWSGQQQVNQGVQRPAVVARPAKPLYRPSSKSPVVASGAMYSDRMQGSGGRTEPTFSVTF